MNNVYLYDQELSAKRHQKFLEQLETRLTDLGISGKISRLGPMTRVEETVRQELAKKPKTIVVVGSDGLASRVAGVMANTNVPLAIIPVGTSMIAEALGAPLKDACRTLAARRIVKVDLGQIDAKHTFVCRAVVSGSDPLISLDGKLSVTAKGKVDIEIVNIVGDQYGYRGAKPKPDDGRLNVYILKKENSFVRKDISQSAFVCRQINMTRGAWHVELDGALEIPALKEVKILKKALTVIVGRERMF